MKQYTFTFAPADFTTYVISLTATREKDLGKQGKQTDATQSEVAVTIRKTDQGYSVIQNILYMAFEKNGQYTENPLADLFQGLTFTINLNERGEILSVQGYEKLPAFLEELFPLEAVESLSPLVEEEELVEKEKSDWNGRIGDFIGVSFDPGETVFSVNDFELPDGETIRYFTSTQFQTTKECADAECVQLEFQYNTSAEALAKQLNTTMESFADLMGDSPSVSGAAVSGHGTRLIEPDTMLVHAETIERTISMAMDIPEHGSVPVKMHETREYTYDYEQGKGFYLGYLSYSIQNREEEFDFGKLSEPEKIFFLVSSFFADVNNGGINYFYYSPSSDYAEETVDALKTIGADRTAEIVFRANAFFPEGQPPRDYDQRVEFLDSLDEDSFEIFFELDEEYDQSGENLDNLLFDYVVQYKEYFE